MTAATIYAHPCAVNWLQLHCTQFDSFKKIISLLTRLARKTQTVNTTF